MKSNLEKLIVLFCIKSHTNLSGKIEKEKLLIHYLMQQPHLKMKNDGSIYCSSM